MIIGSGSIESGHGQIQVVYLGWASSWRNLVTSLDVSPTFVCIGREYVWSYKDHWAWIEAKEFASIVQVFNIFYVPDFACFLFSISSKWLDLINTTYILLKLRWTHELFKLLQTSITFEINIFKKKLIINQLLYHITCILIFNSCVAYGCYKINVVNFGMLIVTDILLLLQN